MLLEALAIDRPSDVDSAMPVEQSFSPEEWLLMRLYRQLEEHERCFVRRAVEGLIAKRAPSD